MSPDAQRVEAAYLDAMKAIGKVIGLRDGDLTIVEPSVDLDRLPASTVTAGRSAITLLAVGAGILDLSTPACEMATADEMLALWTAS